MREVTIRRIYDAADDEGLRVLVDRLWPRGVRRESARVDHWAKGLAPSTELRKWFDHRPERFEAFRAAYRDELLGDADGLGDLLDLEASRPLVLLYAARVTEHNHAVVLREVLMEYQAGRG